MAGNEVLDAIKKIMSCVDNSGQTTLCIDETGEAKLKKLFVSDISSNMLLLLTDFGTKNCKPTCMSPLFNQSSRCDHNRVCDAVLVKNTDKGLAFSYIDLKSDNTAGHVGQFKSTSCFMKYVVNLINELCNIKVSVAYERFIVFHTDSKNASRSGFKTRSRFSPNSPNTPETAHKCVVRNGETVRATEFA